MSPGVAAEDAWGGFISRPSFVSHDWDAQHDNNAIATSVRCWRRPLFFIPAGYR